MPRAFLWLQVLIGWVPLWVLFILLLLTAHGELNLRGALAIATRMVVAGAILSPLVSRVVRRVAWPSPMRIGFIVVHVAAAFGYAMLWFVTNSVIESVVRWQVVLVIGFTWASYVILGVWLYVMQAGVLYAADAATRASRAEAIAAQSQLAALRGQLHPHFLFNALHTIVQLAPEAPDRAARAAEDVAALLRVGLGEQRDLVSLHDEWRFVRRYLDVEQLRFGDRLRVAEVLSPAALECAVPSFALQTLVENAVRHGAAPREAPTTITIRASVSMKELVLEVEDDGVGSTTPTVESGSGSGLRRLRDRLQALFGPAASLELNSTTSGVRAVLRVPAQASEQ